MSSALHGILSRLASLPPLAAHVALDVLLDDFTPLELAAANYDWQLWARPAQIVPSTAWSSFGVLSGRGWGKTITTVSHLIEEIAAGRVHRAALVGQSEQKTIEILVTGETGILALSPPWLGAEYEISSNLVRFANGATATIYTAAEPNGLRGPQHDMAIATEIASWPASTREETMSNLRLGLRLGRGQLLWDSTPRRRNPLVRERLALASKDPARHVVIRGRTEENAINLAPDVVAEWREQWGGTRTGAEELDGEYFDDSADALFRQAWIDGARRKMPSSLKRRIISVDPAITESKRSDSTGIVDLAVGVDGQIYVLANLSGKHRAEIWPDLIVAHYVTHGCDLVLAETNRGGSFIRAALAVACQARGLSLIELGPGEAPAGRAGVLYYRPYTSRGSKGTRAGAAAAVVERGRVSFVGDLGELETRLCDFDGTEGKIDDEVDAFVAGVVELAALNGDNHDARIGFKGIKALSESLTTARVPRSNAATPLATAGFSWGVGGGRI